MDAVRGAHPVRTVFGFVATAALTTLICIAVLGLSSAPLAISRTVIVLGAAALFLAFLVGPLLTGAVDQLDPRRFRPFAVDERWMPWILLLGAFVSVPSAALIAVAVCVAIVAIGAGAPWLVTVIVSVVGVLCTVLVARIAMAIGAFVLPERRSRELTLLFSIPLIVIAVPIAAYFASIEWAGQVPGAVALATSVVGLTPFAAPQELLFSLADSDGAAAWGAGVVMLVTTAVLCIVWHLLVRRLLSTAERPAATRERSGMGWFGPLPRNAFGAIAARSLVYWFRDRRYVVNLIIVPIAGVLTVFPLIIAGVPLWIAALVPVPVMALFFGWLPHNDVAYDSTAIWIHVASGIRGLPDRLGRLIPVLLVAIPVLAVAVSVTLATISSWNLLLPLIGVGASLLLTGLGMSSVLSVVAPYAVSRPGDSPFRQPQRSSSHGSFGAALTFLGALLLSAPTIWLFVLTVVDGDDHANAAFWTGLGSGAVVLLAGALVGGLIFERSGERLMEFAETT